MRQVKARAEPGPEDVSIAAHLLRLRDPATGGPLPDALLAGEFGVFFAAGIESAGNAISWTLCVTYYLFAQGSMIRNRVKSKEKIQAMPSCGRCASLDPSLPCDAPS